MKDEALTFIKTVANKISEQKPMSTVIAGRTDPFDPKVIAYEEKYRLKRKVNNLTQKLVGLKIGFNSERELVASFQSVFWKIL